MHSYPAPLATDYEHVCLTSDEPEEVVPPVPRGATVAKLVQCGGRIEHRFAIIERGYLGVRSTSRTSGTREYWVNLAFLDPRPVRPAGSSWWSMAAALALLCGAFVLGGRVTAGYAAFAAALLTLGLAVHRSLDRLIFCTRHGHVPVVQLLRSRPDRRHVRTFVAALQHAIHEAAARRPGDNGRVLRDEMKEHRRLLEAGVIQPREFEAAKPRILRAHG